jgi:hypothetical protein
MIHAFGDAYALPTAIAAIDGLIIFLGGRNMDEKKQIKFPIASIFCTLGVVCGLINVFLLISQMRDIQTSSILQTAVSSVVALIPSILLAVLLFMRKRGILLWIALGIDLVLDLLSLVSNFSFILRLSGWLLISYLVLPLLGIISGLLFLLFAVFQDRKGKSKAAKIFSAIWFIPGIISVISYFFNAYQAYLGIINGYITAMGWISLFSGLLVSIPMAFLLGWWLTHPYKKERAVYQMPVAQPYGQPYGQPVYQSAGASDAAQKVFCTNCGRELLPDETFCVNCGTRRPEPSRAEPDHAEQKVFCTGCGRELPPDEDFCGACGTKRPTIKGSDHTEQGNHIEL